MNQIRIDGSFGDKFNNKNVDNKTQINTTAISSDANKLDAKSFVNRVLYSLNNSNDPKVKAFLESFKVSQNNIHTMALTVYASIKHLLGKKLKLSEEDETILLELIKLEYEEQENIEKTTVQEQEEKKEKKKKLKDKSKKKKRISMFMDMIEKSINNLVNNNEKKISIEG